MHLLLRNNDGFKISRDAVQQQEVIGPEDSLFHPRDQRKTLVDYSRWKKFVDGRDVALRGLDKNIVRSWRRCQDMAVDPGPRSCWDFTPMDQLEPFTSTLTRISGDIVTTAYNAIKGKKLLLTISNADAKLAHTCGDLDVLLLADKLNFGPGANWAEKSVGTNAIGVALVTGRPMQVFGEEHFCRSHHKWSCTAAPIFDPRGNIWGCFDISGPKESDHSNCLRLALQAARALEQQLCRLYCSELEGQMGSLFSSMFNSVMTGILSVDISGKISSANSAAEALLNCSNGMLRGRKADDFFDYSKFLAHTDMASVQGPVTINCLTDPKLCVRAMPVFSVNGTMIDSIVTVSEMQRYCQYAVSSQSDVQSQASEPAPPKGFNHIIHGSKIMRQAIRQAANAARTPSTILLAGESGTGKELFAKGLHQASPRNQRPFIAVNCGAFSEELVQSELFGYCEGAFTGAMKRGRVGKFQKADKGVLFLDEISEMPLSQQVNLLRALEERAIVPVGGTTPRPVDVKIIAATNKNLQELVRQGRFRKDLFYRLHVVVINIPALRERGNDVILLAKYHLNRLCSEFGIPCEGMDPDAESILQAHDWPGNVRELVNCLEYAVNNLTGKWLQAQHLPPYILDSMEGEVSDCKDKLANGFELKRREEEAIREALDFHQKNISKTAKALGIGRNTLYAKMERYHIQI